MWLMQNFYAIRGLRKQGFSAEADRLKAASLETVQIYYEKWGVVFEYYDALNETDPTQTLRKPRVADAGNCTPGVPGLPGSEKPKERRKIMKLFWSRARRFSGLSLLRRTLWSGWYSRIQLLCQDLR